MAHKYSYYQLRVARQQHMIASLYVEPDDPDAFHAGYVEAVTARHVLLWSVTPWGQKDGWMLRRTEDVLQVFMGDDYEVRLQMLLEMHEETYAPLLPEAPAEDADLMAVVLGHIQQSGEVLSIMTKEDTYTGIITYLDDLRLSMDVYDFFGAVEGPQSFPLRDITMLTLGTNEEAMYKELNAERLKLL